MKSKVQFLTLFAFVLLISFTACMKNTDNSGNNDSEITTHSDDQEQFSSEIDAAANDADLTMESSSAFSGRLSTPNLICDASIDISASGDPKTITITYNGTNCFGNRTRTGSIIISMAQNVQWKNAGAEVTVSFQNLKIKRANDNKSITINGTQTYTNVSGGLLVNLASLNSITHSITSDGLSITFDDGTQRTWHVSKQRVFTYDNGVVITTTGTHADGNNTGIAEWGTNRFGGAFETSILEPLIVRQDCNFRLTSGKVKHTIPILTATATFGLDLNGNPTSCPGNGSYYYKVVWTGLNGRSFNVMVPY